METSSVSFLSTLAWVKDLFQLVMLSVSLYKTTAFTHIVENVASTKKFEKFSSSGSKVQHLLCFSSTGCVSKNLMLYKKAH